MNAANDMRTGLALFLVIALGACGGEGNPAPGEEESGGTGGVTANSGGAGSKNPGGSATGGSATGGSSGVGGKDAGTGTTGGSQKTGGTAQTGGNVDIDAGPVTAPFDWVGVVGTGQSLSQGWESTALSTTQPFANLKLEDDGPDPKYPIAASATAQWKTVPLTEPIRTAVAGTGAGYTDNQYPNNIYHYGTSYGETPHSGMANTISKVRDGYVTAHTVVGFGGAGIKDISKGVRGYMAALNEASVFRTAAAASGKTYGVGAVILTHGEQDSSNPAYGAALYQLWKDYNADLKAVTGQTDDLVMLGSQQSSSPSGYGASYGSAVQLWQAGVDHPGQIVCTGPKYQYGAYGLHMPGPAYEALGEKYGEVFDIIVNQKKPWKPVGPNKVTRVGAAITIDFDVPSPPLVWDTHLAPPHQQGHTAWASGRGFEVRDGSGNELAIASAEIQSSSVVVTLSQTPAAGTALTVGYALTQDTTQAYQGGTDLGPHGLLKDSDSFVGYAVESIDVGVKNGSADLSGAQDAFSRRAARDIVSGDGVPPDTVLKSALPWGLTMSAPWPGATGTVTLSFRHDLANYCVHFAMPVP